MTASGVRLCGFLLAALLAAGVVERAAALSTVFTYQGQLQQGGSAANDTCDFQFSVFDAPSGGSLVGTTQTLNAVGVSDGLFTVPLDFGGSAFAGSDRWLQIAVRCPTGGGTYTALTPRQPLTAAPYALYSPVAGFANDLTCTGCLSTTDLANGAVTTAKIGDGQVSTAKLSAGGSTTGQVLTSNGAGVVWQAPSSAPNAWSLTGNSGTTASNFLGTSDNKPLELWVNGVRALRLEPSQGAYGPNVIAGFDGNGVTAPETTGATIGGGGANGASNTASSVATVGGGAGNTASGPAATIGGGTINAASGLNATVGGGSENTASGKEATVGGGRTNAARKEWSTVGGGLRNIADGEEASVGGGFENKASATAASVAGGDGNTASGVNATVGGGANNQATREDSTVAGGSANGAPAPRATVGGGANNTARGDSNTVAGGFENYAIGDFAATVGGGQSNTAAGNHATAAGGIFNIAGSRASDENATVAGGYGNQATAPFATVGGGGRTNANDETTGNRVTGPYGTVAGGGNNLASGTFATVAGGASNAATAYAATVGGGIFNMATAQNATVGGGYTNHATADNATVAGGAANVASGIGSFAAGVNAHATHQGSFVFSDGTRAGLSAHTNDFNVTSTGGVEFWHGGSLHCDLHPDAVNWDCTSDRNVKENFVRVDARDTLRRVSAMPVTRWNLKGTDPAHKHIGPVAQDFHAAFGLGGETTINTSDAQGVAFAAIQGLYQLLQEKDAAIAALHKQNAALEARLEKLEETVGTRVIGAQSHGAQQPSR